MKYIGIKKWSKNCPKCGMEIKYTELFSLNISIKKNSWCKKCRANERKIDVPLDGWSKKCYSCGNSQHYSTKYVLKNAINTKSLCRKCNGKKQMIFNNDVIFKDNKWCKKCIKCKKDIFYCSKNSAMKHKNIKCNVCARFGMKHSQKTKKKLSLTKIGDKNPNFGKPSAMKGRHHTEEVKYKLRLATINDLKNKGILPSQKNYNPNACKFIEEFGKKNGYNFQHAMNGGEVELYGYFVDGYDREKNIIFEYDEKKHRYKKQKDLIRQNRIVEKIKPNLFIRYDELENRLYDVILGKEIL
jgi:hypothetical protein